MLIWSQGRSANSINSFAIIQPDVGTSPVADSSSDTLILTSSDSSITITGNSTTDTINFQINTALTGDVDGPASATDNAIAVFNGVTGKIIKNSLGILSPAGALSGLTQLSVDNILIDGDTISNTVSGNNLILDYIGAGKVQLGSGLTTKQFLPATRVSALTNNPVLTESSSTGQMSWVDITTLTTLIDLTTVYQNGNVCFVSGVDGTFSIQDLGIGAEIFRVTDNSASTKYFAVTATGPAINSALLKFGSTDQADIFFDTGLVINPKVSGSGILTLGSATGTADADLIINKIGIANSAISATALINATPTSSSARSIMNLQLTFTGSTNSATGVVSNIFDQGTNNSFTGTAFLAKSAPDGTGHATATTNNGIWIQQGFTANFTASAGTHTQYGAHIDMSLGGVGGAGTSGGTFRRYGIFQESISAIAGAPGSDLIMGAFFNNSINTKADNTFIFDSTSTALGDTSLSYISASSLLRVVADGAAAFEFATGGNNCLLNLTMSDAKNIVLNTTTGTKLGTATTQKLGFWNATPVVRPAAYTVTNPTVDRAFDETSTTLTEIANVLGTLITDLQSIGLIG